MHIGYALIVAAALTRFGRTRATRIAGLLYPQLILLVIVATGNHFLLRRGRRDAKLGLRLLSAVRSGRIR